MERQVADISSSYEAVANTAHLLASTEESLKTVAYEVEQLGQKAQTTWQAYRGAERGQERAAKDFWQAAVRHHEAVRRKKVALLAQKRALIERLPTAGQHAVES